MNEGRNKRMKSKVIISIGMMMCAASVFAQHPLVERVTHSNPVSIPVTEENIEWQRIVYREISVKKPVNAGLFYQTEGECFFSHIFKNVLEGKVQAYNYGINDNLMFSQSNAVDIPVMLKNFQIPFTRTDNSTITIDPNDIPSNLVKAFYIKESHYYDTRNSSFRTRCLAICPIMFQQDDFEYEETKYPMFWIKYSELEPLLKDVLVFGDAYNSSSVMSVNEFFSANFYDGSIYKVFDMSDVALAQYCKTPEELVTEQQRIESELHDVKLNCYNLQRKHEVVKPVAVVENKKNTQTNLLTRIKSVFKKQK